MPDETEEGCSSLREFVSELAQAMDETKDDQMLAPTMGIDDMKYPMEVHDIQLGRLGLGSSVNGETGSYVSIRPCAKEHEGKTFLGILLGDLPVGFVVVYRPSTKKLTVVGKDNPAIFVPDLGKIVFGCESWWGPIKSPEQLREITKEDINNVWYVQALKALTRENAEDVKEE
ncbi:MAG: hypothetical protein ACYTBJ_18980 [Planctomycetota bacterium]|jgi:hypothetical protein